MKESEFPEGTVFYIKEFDVPLAHIPDKGWVNFYGGHSASYDPSSLRVDNNWRADSFEQWLAVVEKSIR
jgi:hypothetical protein